jgi:general stress protein 26
MASDIPAPRFRPIDRSRVSNVSLDQQLPDPHPARTNTSSGKLHDLHSDNHINISFLNSSSGDWASISGISNILTDRATIKKYYSPSLRSWLGNLGDGTHDGGPDDPRLGIIRVTTNTVTYAVQRKSVVRSVLDAAEGVITRHPPHVSRLREISSDEVQQWRSAHKGD